MSFKDDLDTAFGEHLKDGPEVADVSACPGCGNITVSEEFLRRAVLAPIMVDAQRVQIEAGFRSGQGRFPVPGGLATMREGPSGLCVICIHRGQMSAPGYEVQNL
jgi:hypothetical protein